MFRTVSVNSGERIATRDQWLVVTGESGEHRIPIEDIYSVIVDNRQMLLTVPALTRLTENGAHVLLCDEHHLPVSVILPMNTHYHPLSVIRKQIALPEEIKNALWDKIVRQKILNQARVLSFCVGKPERCKRLRELAEEVCDGDSRNREGIAARIFFRELYGSEFIRMCDDPTNAALNYGYTIVRTAVAKTLTAYGYNCVLGLHHINEANPFNLADDLMEPLRPAVDYWAYQSRDDLVDALTKQQRNELAALVNTAVLYDGKRMRMRNAIDRYVSSLTSAVNKLSPKLLKLPELVRDDPYNDVDD